MTKKLRTARLPDYGDEEINRLAEADLALSRMTAEERVRAFHWFKSKWAGEWPNDQ